MKEKKLGIFLLIPSIIITVSIIVYPILYSFWLSFTDKRTILPTANFIGLENYRALFNDPLFYNALKNGVIFSGASLAIQLAIGLTMALVLNERFKGRTLVRGITIFPWFMPHIISILIWKWMLHDTLGIFNYVFIKLGLLAGPRGWLGDPDTAMLMVLFINAWIFSPYITIWTLARLQTIPDHLYEAAKVDGASAFSRFIHVTLPELKGIFAIALLLRFIWMFNKFDTIYLLTEGGPLHRTETVPIFAYFEAFVNFEQGFGSAIVILLFFILAIFSFIYLRQVLPSGRERIL